MLASKLVLVGAGALLYCSNLCNAISCPQLSDPPVKIDVVEKSQRLELEKSSFLCVLVRVKHADPTNQNEVVIDNNSPRKDFIIKPVGKSFNMRKWQRSAGNYATSFRVRRCKGNVCNTVLKKKGTYYLMTLPNEPATQEEKLARFFLQTTFGPTKEMISEFPYDKNQIGMARWMRDQIEMEPTKHREYYRKKADYTSYKGIIHHGNVDVQHPCAGYSRWRRHSFTSADGGGQFNVVAMGNNWFVFVIDGIARTSTYGFSGENGLYFLPGQYEFGIFIGAKVGGQIQFRPRNCLSCQYDNLTNGNPQVLIYLPGAFWTAFAGGLRFINLPAITEFEELPETTVVGWGTGDQVYDNASVRLNNAKGLFETEANACAFLGNNFDNIVGIHSDGYMSFFAAYADFKENTIENPISDGGLSSVEAGAHNCANVAMNYENIDGCFLSTDLACESSSHHRQHWKYTPVQKRNVVVCGSDGEVENEKHFDASETGMFQPFGTFIGLNLHYYAYQKRNVPNMVFLNAKDQLRQRMAWALSQILVITPNQIETSKDEAEVYLNYYDIFVKHAFGNYRDVLKAVSYSPMMAEMLSFLESKSASYVLKTEGRVSRPDENFAREIMQLFSIGLYKLHSNGDVVLTKGVPVLTYSNSDIQTFARAWTGFKRENNRFNRDGIDGTPNRIDPMAIEGTWRDPLPKLDLHGNYIGDKYPLCTELPSQQFLRKGAIYRLMGSVDHPEMQYEILYGGDQVERFKLDVNSELYGKLCNKNSVTCNFLPQITLDENLSCLGKECDIDNLSVVIVQDDPEFPVQYEYVRPVCVEHAFYDESTMKKIVNRDGEAMCLNEAIDDIAMDACCLTTDPTNFLYRYAYYLCEFSFERTSFNRGQTRCETKEVAGWPDTHVCDWKTIHVNAPDNVHDNPGCKINLLEGELSWHWTDQSCSVSIKVNPEGLISFVHNPNLDINTDLVAENLASQEVFKVVDSNNINYFKIKWDDDYPSISNQCGNGACETIGDDCLCEIDVNSRSVFDSIQKRKKITNTLSIGNASPDVYDQGTYTLVESNKKVSVFKKEGQADYGKNTIFGIKYHGKEIFLKNEESIVSVRGTSFSFRNPKQFLNVAKPDTRDASYETEAVLDHYFYHKNVAPFLAIRLMQRFGISNPSPLHISHVANAFKKGTYNFKGISFGSGKYGDLEALLAAALLDKEVIGAKRQADPGSGQLREPFVKLMSVLRSMEYQSRPNFPSLTLVGLQDLIGQEVNSIPNVFSFFLPEFSPPGKVAEATLTAPEAQVLNGPKILGLLNGLYSLIDLGMTTCYGGFGDANTWVCSLYESLGIEAMQSRGSLTYEPTADTPEGIVDELALLLTGGRLSAASRTLIINAYNEVLQSSDDSEALRTVQKLLVSTPEFHVSNYVDSIGTPRPQSEPATPSAESYKSIVYVNLQGGLDSFNVLVPHSNCDGDTVGNTMYDKYRSARGEVALHQNSLLTIDATSSNQVCDTFGLHENLPYLQTLYQNNDLLFLSNVGYLTEPATKENWQQTQLTALFSHNTQQEELNIVDLWDSKDGRGVGGRMLDVLSMDGYKPGSISIAGISSVLRANEISQTVSDASGFRKFNPTSVFNSDITDKVRELNDAASIKSSFYSETWSEALFQTLDENEQLYSELSSIETTATFPETDLGNQLREVAKLMKTKDARGTDRDIFHTSIVGFDMHSQLALPLVERLTTINDALEAFVSEMEADQIWDDVVVVFVSEFGRTLMGNTGNGTDHAWGGNYFIASGSVDGGKILGQYPSDLSNSGPSVTEGIVIPDHPWESLWNGLAEWFGVVSDADLETVLPNRNTFIEKLWSGTDLFTNVGTGSDSMV